MFKEMVGRIGLGLKSTGPDILIGVGVVAAIGAVVYACVQTTKADKIIEEHKQAVADLKDEELEDSIDKRAYRKRLAKIYARSAWKFTKLYFGPVAVLALAISCMLYSHVMLRRTLAATVAAYEAVNKSFGHYRGNVIDRYGEDVDKELMYDLHEEKLKDVDPELAKEIEDKKAKTKVMDGALGNYSQYAIIYDDGCNGWTKSPEWNKFFLLDIQARCNDILNDRGYLFLNDVYTLLGVPTTEAGQVVGWLKGFGDVDPETGRSIVSFEMFDVYRHPKNADFIDGYEPTIILDFNVDGYILDKVWAVDKKYPRRGNN